MGPLIIVGIIMLGVTQANYQEIKDNWVQYRCNPLYMPFSSMFSDVSTSENFQFCTNSYAQYIFELLTQPIHLMFSLFTKVISGITGSLDKFRGFTTGMQNFILSYANDFFGKLGNSVSAIVSLIGRIRDLTQRIVGTAGYTAVIASTSVNFMISVFEFSMTLLRSLVGIIFGLGVLLSIVFPPLLFFFIPIGASLGMTYSCFHPDTSIRMADGSYVLLKHIKVGDEIASGRVTAVMRFDASNIPLYEYNDVIVAGNHLVRENREWKYVKDAYRSYIYIGDQPDEIICLNTTTHQIVINGITFSDYEECDDEPPSYTPLSPEDKIDEILLKDLYPGFITSYGKIIGVVYLENNKMQVFMENDYSGMFLINNETLVRDYPDSHDVDTLERIQERVLQKLNGKT
jgi:hypothetical protein